MRRCGRPPRLRGQTKLRAIFLDRAATPPLQGLCKGGEYATLGNNFCEEGIIRPAATIYGTSMIGACQNAAFCPVGSRTVI
jgi:hypothetical protein